jgi:hypothetical protein
VGMHKGLKPSPASCLCLLVPGLLLLSANVDVQVSTPSSMTQLVADEQEALKDLVKACCPGLGAPGSPEAKAAAAAAAAGLGTVSGWCSSVGRAVTYDLRQW